MKKKNNNRKKLTSLVLLLFLTIIMLSTATYAWFTSNRTVTISSLNVNVTAKSGLQISADGIMWKTVLTNDDLKGARTTYTNAVNQIPSVLEPVSSAGTVAAGRMEMFRGTIGEDQVSGDYTIVSTKLTDQNTSTTGDYIAFDIFLRTELDSQLYLTTSSGVVAHDPTGQNNPNDRGLKNAARIAFLVPRAVAGNPDSAPQSIESGSSTTDIQGQLPNTSIIWEPNYDVHTPNGVAAAAQYGLTITQGPGDPRIEYDGIFDEFAVDPDDPLKLIKVLEADESNYPDLFKRVNPRITTIANETSFKTAFMVKAGITKVRVYMWIEGQDVDCENNASGTDVSFNVQFSLNDQ